MAARMMGIGTGVAGALLWHVTANEASPTALTRGRLDTRQDTPPDAFRV